MYKSLNPQVLGIAGRQSEIIELALTYGFRGIEWDIVEFARRVEVQGLDRAKRFLESGHLRLSGFDLPMRWRGDETVFQSELAKLAPLAGYAAAVGAKACHTTIVPATDMFPYHENFELHRKRLAAMADLLGQHGIRLAVSFLAAPAHRADKNFQFIYEANALITLIKSVPSTNLGLVLDTWNWHYGRGTFELLQSLSAERIVSVRIADIAPPAENGDDAPAGPPGETIRDELRSIPQETDIAKVRPLLAQLVELGFKGPVSLDPDPSCWTGMTRETIVQKVSACLDELLPTTVAAKATPRPALTGTK